MVDRDVTMAAMASRTAAVEWDGEKVAGGWVAVFKRRSTCGPAERGDMKEEAD